MDQLTLETHEDQITTTIKSELAKKFNHNVGEFVRKLITTYPADILEFKVIYNKILIAIAAAPEMMIQKYAQFLGDNANEDMSKMIKSTDNAFFAYHASKLTIFDGLDMTSNWEASPDSVRQAIWSYMILLTNIAESYTAISNQNMMPDASEAIAHAVALSTDMLKEFGSKHNRKPNCDDDISHYAERLASEMGVDMSLIDNLDLSNLATGMGAHMKEFSKHFDKEISTAEGDKIAAFMGKQLENLQRSRRLAKQRKMLE
jgi:hypothetical protein